MEKKLLEGNLPQSYMNLGFDAEPNAGPSAPKIYEGVRKHEDYAEPVPGPSAPPPKYEEGGGPSLGAPGVHLKVPTAPAAEVNLGPAILKYTSPYLVFEDIYEACIKYVESNCCYSSKFAKQMKLTDIKNDCAFHYSLESFGEKRESASRFTPYKGGPIDGPSNGRPPEPWDMYVPILTLFKDAKAELIIPHTDEVETCYRCSGSGKVTCSSCGGSGYSTCWSCSGSGRDSDNETCSSCSGGGRNTCSSCWGSGRVTCSRCDGYGQVKNYKVLIVTWKNHPNEFVTDIRQLPSKKLIKTTGDTLLSQESIKLSPIINAPVDNVNMASAQLLEAHRNSFRTEEIRKQRHSLRAIPFTIVQYKWKEEEGEFYVYGKEKEVFFESYPTNCCCCVCC